MIFTIKQGQHYSNQGLYKWYNRNVKNPKLGYSVVLSDSCWYQNDIVAYSGWNKIFGFGAKLHHWNSARLVWQPNFERAGKLTVSAYVYEMGSWIAIPFAEVSTNSAVSMGIQVVDNRYVFYCGKEFVDYRHHNPQYDKALWPYFGGWDRAYTDMSVSLQRINDIKWIE